MAIYDFEYDGKKLSDYGYIIGGFDNSGETTSIGSELTFNMVSTLGGAKYERINSIYESCLEMTFQIVKNPCAFEDFVIKGNEFRELVVWLNRKDFHKLKLIDDEDDSYDDIYFEASFNCARVDIDGAIQAVELTAYTNRPFAVHDPYTLEGSGTFTTHISGTTLRFSSDEASVSGEKVTINMDSKDAYVNGQTLTVEEYWTWDLIEDDAWVSDEEGYEYVPITIKAQATGNLSIYSPLEDRTTYIKNCTNGETITMDYPVISTSRSAHEIQNDFNWNFFRIATTYDHKGTTLTVSLPCTISFEYSPAVKLWV